MDIVKAEGGNKVGQFHTGLWFEVNAKMAKLSLPRKCRRRMRKIQLEWKNGRHRIRKTRRRMGKSQLEWKDGRHRMRKIRRRMEKSQE